MKEKRRRVRIEEFDKQKEEICYCVRSKEEKC